MRDTAANTETIKTAEERAEDASYTINHSLTCLATDFVTNPLVGAVSQKWLGKRFALTGWKFTMFGREFRFGTCDGFHPAQAHTHDHDHAHAHGDHCDHDHAPKGKQTRWQRITNSLVGHTVMGEIVGDLAGVPITIAFQRLAPGLMHGLRKVMEPVLGPLFRFGARRSAERWAEDHHAGHLSGLISERAQSIYEHEMSHLPQAAMWTVSSLTFNTITQKITGNKNPLWVIAVSCGLGVASTAALVVGGRSLAPQTARRWDQFTSRHIFTPISRLASRLAGRDKNALVQAEQSEQEYWKGRLEAAGVKADAALQSAL